MNKQGAKIIFVTRSLQELEPQVIGSEPYWNELKKIVSRVWALQIEAYVIGALYF